MLSKKIIDYLLELRKYKQDDTCVEMPFTSGQRIDITLSSTDPNEFFDIIIRCGRIELNKFHIINRARKCICLIRIDLDETAVHLNPNGDKINGPHIHIYSSEYGDKYAYPLPNEIDCNNIQAVLNFFISKSNITDPPNINFNTLFKGMPN